jgi:hypothetical protein
VITYSTNWMGPISTHWYRERGLVENENITTYYCAGRIDIRDDSKCGYDGWDEYGLRPMHGESWGKLSYSELIERFETETGHKIRWWVDNE